MSRTRFWLSAVAVAFAFAAATAWFFPYETLRIESASDRQRAWLLTLWTGGVICICFGATALLSTVIPIGFRDVAEAGSVSAAQEARRREVGPSASFYNFGGWLLTTGILLLGVYFANWLWRQG